MKRYKIVPISFFSHDYEIRDGNRAMKSKLLKLIKQGSLGVNLQLTY